MQEVETASEGGIGVSPSTQRQFDLARWLVEELRGLGVAGRGADRHLYVYGHLPATPEPRIGTCLGFIAHMDTWAGLFRGKRQAPHHRNYDGGDVGTGRGRTLSVKASAPARPERAGRSSRRAATRCWARTHKAGIAEIMTAPGGAAEGRRAARAYSSVLPPDEEVGCGTANFRHPRWAPDYAYTLDGGPEGEGRV